MCAAAIFSFEPHSLLCFRNFCLLCLPTSMSTRSNLTDSRGHALPRATSAHSNRHPRDEMEFPQGRLQAAQYTDHGGRRHEQYTDHGGRRPRNHDKPPKQPTDIYLDGEEISDLSGYALSNGIHQQGHTDNARLRITANKPLYQGVLTGPWNNSPLIYWKQNISIHKNDPSGFVRMCAYHLQAGFPQEVVDSVQLTPAGEYNYEESVRRLVRSTGLSRELCFHILVKTNKIGRWVAWLTRHLHKTRRDLFIGSHNYVLPLDRLATAEMAQYTPQEMALGIILNTKSRFVVWMEYRTPDGQLKKTEPGLKLPQDANVSTMTGLYLSAIGGQSSAIAPSGADEPDPETERPRACMRVADFMATGATPVQSRAPRRSTNAPRPQGMRDFIHQDEPVFIMHATDLLSLAPILRHGLVPSNLLQEVVTSQSLQLLVHENSRPPHRNTVDFSPI